MRIASTAATARRKRDSISERGGEKAEEGSKRSKQCRAATALHSQNAAKTRKNSDLNKPRNLHVGIHVGLIVDARDLEAEQPQKVGLIAGEIREFVDRVVRHLAPQRFHALLHFRVQL